MEIGRSKKKVCGQVGSFKVTAKYYSEIEGF